MTSSLKPASLMVRTRTAGPGSAPLGPPRPPLAFRVGIVGHRPTRLDQADPGALAGAIHNILLAVTEAVREFHESDQGLYTRAPAVLRAVSPLAEGTDRIFAERALSLGFALCCP